MSGVDELFGGGKAPPPSDDRLRVIVRWLVFGAILDLAGPCCFTGVPGAAVTLWAWYLADEEVTRAENGLLDPAVARRAVKVRATAFALLLVTSALILLQIGLFVVGFYPSALRALGRLLA